MSTCRACPHDRADHEHYRVGHECSKCSCPAFRRNRLAELGARILRRGNTGSASTTSPPRPRRNAA